MDNDGLFTEKRTDVGDADEIRSTKAECGIDSRHKQIKRAMGQNLAHGTAKFTHLSLVLV